MELQSDSMGIKMDPITETPGVPGAASQSTGNDDESGRIFVGGLTQDTSADDLRIYFSKFGGITDATVKYDFITGNSRGFGFVIFLDKDAINNVFKEPVHVLKGKQIDPKRAEAKSATGGGGGMGRGRGAYMNAMAAAAANGGDDLQVHSITSPAAREEDTRKVFVGGLTQETTADDLRCYFCKFGGISDANVKYDFNTGKSRGFGFVIFTEKPAIDNIFKEAAHIINGKQVDPKRAESKERTVSGQAQLQAAALAAKAASTVSSDSPESRKVFLGGLDQDLSVEGLKDALSVFGKVNTIDWPVDKNQTTKKRQFCFVTFEETDSAHSCLAAGTIVCAGKKLDVAPANPYTNRSSRSSIGWSFDRDLAKARPGMAPPHGSKPGGGHPPAGVLPTPGGHPAYGGAGGGAAVPRGLAPGQRKASPPPPPPHPYDAYYAYYGAAGYPPFPVHPPPPPPHAYYPPYADYYGQLSKLARPGASSHSAAASAASASAAPSAAAGVAASALAAAAPSAGAVAGSADPYYPYAQHAAAAVHQDAAASYGKVQTSARLAAAAAYHPYSR